MIIMNTQYWIVERKKIKRGEDQKNVLRSEVRGQRSEREQPTTVTSQSLGIWRNQRTKIQLKLLMVD